MTAIRAIRGATTTQENTKASIEKASVELAHEIIKTNEIDPEEIAVVLVTMTADLSSYNASAAMRLALGWQHVPFFTSQEAEIESMLPRCIRVSILYNTDKSQKEMKHIYLNDAIKLRPDLKK